MTDTRDRAERAFAEAFAARAAEPEPLDPAALRTARPPAPGRRRWLPLAAAAVVVVVAGAVGVVVLRGPGPSGSPGVPAAAPGGVAARDAAAEGAGGTALSGFRTVSMLDVVVEVPQGWGYDRALGPDWCAEGARRRPGDPFAPFVDVRPEGRAVRAIACGGDVPAERQTMHLTWRHADAARGTVTPPAGWTRLERRVGAAVLTVVAPEGERELAEQILGTARQVAVDHLGCPAVAPATASDPAADGATLCQYDDPRAGVPSLVGSRVLDVDAAARLRRALATGEPVDPTPCSGGGDTLVTLGSVRLRVPSCGAAFVDDGEARRAVNAAACGLVFVAPLALPDGRLCG